MIAGHRVSLDDPADSEHAAAFGDLYEYVRWHADPLWHDDEPRIIAKTGEWAGRAVLGEEIISAIIAAAPVTVLVTVPEPADQALLWPLELAYADGAPLAARGDVSFVYCLGTQPASPSDGPRRPLRMLAVFSSPVRARVLDLRRERYELAALAPRIAARDGTAIELTVLQYGATRQRLREILGPGDWDVVHLSGHGDRGRFLLEQPDGSKDYISTADLAALLRPARSRLRLAVLSSCSSAAETATETLRVLGLPAAQAKPDAEPDAGHAGQVTGLARGLAEELGCAVVATRFPVSSEFAVAFQRVFYERMLSGTDAAGAACANALAAVLAGTDHWGTDAATIGVFGANAAGLVLRAPTADPPSRSVSADTASGQMDCFPGQPERFIGRDTIMTEASMALRAGSGTTAVLLHGMPGIGKTACLLELAYLCRDQFTAAAFWRPPADSDPGPVLRSLADALHQQLGNSAFPPPPPWDRQWITYAGRLREAMRDGRVLVVIDDLDDLLTPDGGWRDPRWAMVFGALAAHGGGSRLGAAARLVPGPLGHAPAENVLRLGIGALARNETAILARQTPVLRPLVLDDSGDGPQRLREVLDRVQGHPGLLEAGEAAAARTEQDIGEWATATLAALAPDAALMARFIAGLEPRDRRLAVISRNWRELWRRLARPGAAPGPGPLLDTVAAAALTGREKSRPLHPAAAAAIRHETPDGTRAAIDRTLAEYWETSEQDSATDLAALPYLIRLEDWDSAAVLLGDAIRRGALRPGGSGDFLPDLRQVAASTAAAAAPAALALALRFADGAEARRLMETSLASAESVNDYALAWRMAGYLASLILDTGRAEQALDVAVRQERYARAAGLGPWTRLAGQSVRLDIMVRLKRNEQALVEVSVARDRMRRLPEEAASGELPGIVPWAVREDILRVGHSCALAFGKWEQAVGIGTEVTDSQRRRGADRAEIARTRFYNAFPLIRLRRLTEAAELLVESQQAFEDTGNNGMLGLVFRERADLEMMLKHPDSAVRFARTALRLAYTSTTRAPIASAHEGLAFCLRAVGDAEEERAHWLAAVLVYRLSGLDRAPDNIMLGLPLSVIDNLPALAEVTEIAERSSGVHLAELIAQLEPDTEAVERMLAEIRRTALSKLSAATARSLGRQVFARLGGYELAADPGVASVVNRFRRWLAPPAGDNEENT